MVHPKITDKRVCAACDSDKTYIRPESGRPHWFRWDGLWLCKKCRVLYVDSPIKRQKWGKHIDPKRINFHNKIISIKYIPRKGICSRCGKKKGDEYHGWRNKEKVVERTSLHHWFYLVIMPWACTEELCYSCHTKESWRLGQYSSNR